MPRFLGRINRQHIHGATCSESEHQQALISWARDTEELQTDDDIREALHWFHHVPNGGRWRKPYITRSGRKLPPLEAVMFKAEGVVAGVWDLRLDWVRYEELEDVAQGQPETQALGLIGEMKKPGNPLTPEQKRYVKFMTRQGFQCVVWYIWQKAARDLTEYLRLERIAPVFVQIENQRFRSISTPAQLLSETF